MKPDGSSLVIYVASPVENYQYGVANPEVSSWIQNYLASQTGTSQSTITVPQEMAALFDQNGPNLLTNPVLKGTYHVSVSFLSSGTREYLQGHFLFNRWEIIWNNGNRLTEDRYSWESSFASLGLWNWVHLPLSLLSCLGSYSEESRDISVARGIMSCNG